jgi:gluconate 2-dehydrogenase gamma chain
MNINRRELCQQLIWVGFGSYFAVATGACRRTKRGEQTSGEPSEARFLTPAEGLTLAAACERLFPRDEDPGAIDLGAPGFVDRQLASEAFSGWQETFRTGLADLDADARESGGVAFVELKPEQQDALLDRWLHGSDPQKKFVHRLMHLTLEGVFCDPSHGGNHGGRAWELVGFAPSAPRPRAHATCTRSCGEGE